MTLETLEFSQSIIATWGLVEPEDLNRCVAMLRGQSRRGEPLAALEDVLVQQDLLTPAQAQRVKAEAQKRQGHIQLGPFELLTNLGEGLMGRVYKAQTRDRKKLLALKLLKTELTEDSAFIERFRREAQSCMRMKHPYIVETLGIGTVEDYHYIAMRFMPGGNCDEAISRRGILPEFEAVCITMNVALALHHAHELGFVHRDVKPANILFDEQNVAKLSDFGLVKNPEVDASVTEFGIPIGTPDYMSPEQALGKDRIDGRSDLYALGACLYHFVTGRPPFIGNTSAHVLSQQLSATPIAPQERNPLLSSALSAIVMKLLQKDPLKRYRSALELACDLDRLLQRLPPVFVKVPIYKASVQPNARTAARHRRQRRKQDAGGTTQLAPRDVLALNRKAQQTNPTARHDSAVRIESADRSGESTFIEVLDDPQKILEATRSFEPIEIETPHPAGNQSLPTINEQELANPLEAKTRRRYKERETRFLGLL